MPYNENDTNKSIDELQAEANMPGVSENRVKEIIAALLVKTVQEWKNAGWFTEWARITPEGEAMQFLRDTHTILLTLEMYEYCEDVDRLIAQLQLFHSLDKRA